jgi:hypothetical protein
MVPRISKRLPLIFIVLAILGCSRKGSRPVTYPVSGKVLLEGKPVDAVDVAFLPKKPRPLSHPARGRTNATGEFHLQTYFSPSDDAAGAVADQYTVALSKTDAPTGMIDPEKRRPPANQLPARYASFEQSDLSAEVTAGGPNRFEFNLRK